MKDHSVITVCMYFLGMNLYLWCPGWYKEEGVLTVINLSHDRMYTLKYDPLLFFDEHDGYKTLCLISHDGKVA